MRGQGAGKAARSRSCGCVAFIHTHRLDGRVPVSLTALQQVREELESPFPDWADPLARFLFTVPQWIQIAGAILAVALAVVLGTIAWRRRSPIAAWVGSRTATLKWAMVGLGAVLLVAGTALGWQTWSYMHHDNDFCMSCHVMDVPFERFTTSEHAELQCHDCHRQSVAASVRQIYLWVAERPEEIGPHAPVPNRICAECHIVQDPDSTWQRISATAGHRVHLESDSLAELMCVNCHGVEVHRFVPVDQTCGQSGCHSSEKTQIVLGSMAGQTGFHCVTCHEFTAPVPEHAARDTARAALVPAEQQCLSCHGMEKVVTGLVSGEEPHGAVCGICHNPHTQESPEIAAETCAAGDCHARADTLTPFHRGLRAGVLETCETCHEAHVFVVEGEECTACHAGIARGRRSGEQASRPSTPVLLTLYIDLRAGGSWPQPGQQPGQQGFDHLRHGQLQCTDCHSVSDAHGTLTVRTARDCQSCHHAPQVVQGGCQRCHGPEEIEVAREISLPMRFEASGISRTRTAAFDHDAHQAIACAACHGEPVTLATNVTCESCHEDHHRPTAQCSDCHGEPPPDAHTLAVHTEGCTGSGCHPDATYGRLTAGRETCLACHWDLAEHEPGQACARCHQVDGGAVGVAR